MNSDFKDLLVILDQEDVRYLVVGGYAVIFHSQPRYTKDLDIWLEPTPDNAEKVMRAFAKFGVSTFGLDRKDFETEGTQLNVGMPPVAIDFLTTLPGVQFDQAWKNRETTTSDEITIQYLSKADLISAKREAARAVDLADIEELERGE
ncbi:MAG: hypothetical protein P1U85_15335 [Verrucomicrobiales bacterium]|jgi:hypothetical protein|nr:hypothetical protein [Verrucomicrobiales bacterium]